MSNSNLVSIKIPAHSNNYRVGRSGRKIEMITIHHMAGILTAEECGKIFQDGSRIASSHYGIGKDGKIGLYVDEENTAYTNSNFDSNCKSVTIETSNSALTNDYPVSDEVLNVLIRLIADIAKRNNLGTLIKAQNLTWHQMHSNTDCPGEYLLSKIDYIIAEANKINNNASIPPTSDKKSNDEIATEVISGKWGNGNNRKEKLEDSEYNYSDIQKIVNQRLANENPNTNIKKSNNTIAQEVIQGIWGNGEERKNRLASVGYDYNTIQKIVNNILK